MYRYRYRYSCRHLSLLPGIVMVYIVISSDVCINYSRHGYHLQFYHCSFFVLWRNKEKPHHGILQIRQSSSSITWKYAGLLPVVEIWWWAPWLVCGLRFFRIQCTGCRLDLGQTRSRSPVRTNENLWHHQNTRNPVALRLHRSKNIHKKLSY